MNRWVLLGIVIFLLAGIYATPKWSAEQEQAIEIGREFLEGIGLQPGKVLSVGVLDEVPVGYSFYWHSAKGLEIPDISDPELCWVVRFEHGSNPGHFWEVLIDVNTCEVVGGMSCR
jgi:uncharacterized protein YcfL